MNRLLARFLINAIRLSGRVELYQPTYNPRGYRFMGKEMPSRECEDRLQQIAEAVSISSVNSYLDVGSQIGFYVFRLAELNRNMRAVGVEKSRAATLYAEALKELNGIHNVTFANYEMTAESARNLSTHDLISFMNVFHHVVHFRGFDAADGLMRKLFRKCGRYFVFESGQFDEKGFYWSEDLSFMGSDPVEWIRDYLMKIGYAHVRLLALNTTHLSDRKRALFLCTKDS